MSDEMLVRHCSPTLAGLKTGSMFSYAYTTRQELNREISKLNKQLRSKGLRVLPLRVGERRALIYVYRPNMLRSDMSCSQASEILQQCGYESLSPDRCIVRLIGKLRSQEEFPHEIGLFLGYPAEDVCGFIEHKGACCKCIGHWKVYGDAEKAKKTFRKYRSCTDCYIRQVGKGHTIEQLTVAV